MNIKIMRWLDYYIGIPVLFLLSLYNSFIQLVFPRHNEKQAIKKIAIIKLFGIGSVVLGLPTVDFIKKNLPTAELFYTTFTENKEMLELDSYFNEEHLLLIDHKSFSRLIKSGLSVLNFLRKREIDTFIDFEFFSRFATIFSYFTGAERRIGFSSHNTLRFYRGNLLTHRVYYNPYLHTAKSYMLFARPVVEHQEDDKDILLKRIDSTTSSKNKLLRLLRNKNPYVKRGIKLVVVNVNAGELSLERRWPKNRFVKLIDLITSHYGDVFIVLTGSSEEVDYVGSIIAQLKYPERVINVAGDLSIKQLIDLFNLSHLFITNDSGPMHLAALTEINIIALFGPETPLLYRPLSKKVYVFYHQTANNPCLTVFNGKRSSCAKLGGCRCMETITLDEVWRKTQELLNK